MQMSQKFVSALEGTELGFYPPVFFCIPSRVVSAEDWLFTRMEKAWEGFYLFRSVICLRLKKSADMLICVLVAPQICKLGGVFSVIFDLNTSHVFTEMIKIISVNGSNSVRLMWFRKIVLHKSNMSKVHSCIVLICMININAKCMII